MKNKIIEQKIDLTCNSLSALAGLHNHAYVANCLPGDRNDCELMDKAILVIRELQDIIEHMEYQKEELVVERIEGTIKQITDLGFSIGVAKCWTNNYESGNWCRTIKCSNWNICHDSIAFSMQDQEEKLNEK